MNNEAQARADAGGGGAGTSGGSYVDNILSGDLNGLGFGS